jgi:hypothetical protein
MLWFACCTSSLDTGKIMQMLSMALLSLIEWNSSVEVPHIGSSLVGCGLGGHGCFGFGVDGVLSGLG